MQFGGDKITKWRIKLGMELELSLCPFFCLFVCLFVFFFAIPKINYRLWNFLHRHIEFYIIEDRRLLRKHVASIELKNFTTKTLITFFFGYLNK